MVDLEVLIFDSEISENALPSLVVSRLKNGLFALSLVDPENGEGNPSFHFSLPPSADPGADQSNLREEIEKLEDTVSEGSINPKLEGLIESFNKMILEGEDWFNKSISDMERLGDSYDLRITSILIGEASRVGYEINNDIPFIYWLYNHIGSVVDKMLEDEKVED